jgi:hypothetical protein
MYYSYVEIEYVATSFSPARTDLAVKLLRYPQNKKNSGNAPVWPLNNTTDYCTIEIFEAGKGFLSGFDKNPMQVTKIIFGCRNGEIIMIPMKISYEVINSCCRRFC